jgi:diguanylate cyclase (GGDEF)-like protein
MPRTLAQQRAPCAALLGALFLLIAWAGGPAFAAQPDIQHIAPPELQNGISLSGKWRFKWGDDPSRADPHYDDSDWQQVDVPQRQAKTRVPQSPEFSWYRLTLHFEPATLANPDQLSTLAVQIGKVLSAYELYAGGELIGGVGKLPPLSEANYDEMRIYPLPVSAIDADGTLVLALRVWGGSALSMANWGVGPYEGRFELGSYVTLLNAAFLGEIPRLAMTVLFLGFGLYHTYLYHRNRQLRTYLWYGLVAINIALFCWLGSQLRYYLNWPFEVYEKIEFSTIYLLPALFIEMLWSLLARPVGRVLRAYQCSFVVFSVAALCSPGLAFIYHSLIVYEFLCLPLIGMIPWLIIREARAGNKEARTTVTGLVIFVLAALHDLMIDIAGWETGRLLSIGFVAIMVSMAVSLANRFSTMLDNLEGEVAQRTRELSSANRQLAAAAREDPLTGLLNRRGFIEAAERERQRFTRNGRAFSVILADLDDFKRLNDRHGHACGDLVLQEVARILGDRVRDMDSVARWGGEEFVLLIPETGTEGAALLAENLRLALTESEFRHCDQALDITMTLGVATYVVGESIEQCIARADEAMYSGKDCGRNQVQSALPA